MLKFTGRTSVRRCGLRRGGRLIRGGFISFPRRDVRFLILNSRTLGNRFMVIWSNVFLKHYEISVMLRGVGVFLFLLINCVYKEGAYEERKMVSAKTK